MRSRGSFGPIANDGIPWVGYKWTPPTIVSKTSGECQIFVDASRPDDTGAGTSLETAKKTIGAAQTLATAGQIVYVVAGSYSISASFYKQGVDWMFEFGCSVTAASSEMYRANGGSGTTTVYGYGDFYPSSASGTGACYLVQNGIVNWYCNSVTVSGASNNAFTVDDGAKTLNVWVLNDINASQTSGRTIRAGATSSGGTLNLHARDIFHSGDNELVLANSGKINLIFRRMYSDNGATSACPVTCTTAGASINLLGERLWAGTATTVSSARAIQVDSSSSGTAPQLTVRGCEIRGSGSSSGVIGVSANTVLTTVTLDNCNLRVKRGGTGAVINRSSGSTKPNLVFHTPCYLTGAFTNTNFNITNPQNIIQTTRYA